MFDSRDSKKLPLFSAYLQQAMDKHPAPEAGFWGVSGCVAAPLALIGITLVLAKFMSTLLAVAISTVIGVPVVFGLITWLAKLLYNPRTPEQERRARFRSILQKYHPPLSRKKLHREFDPVAGQLMEAAAFHYNRIQTGLSTAAWTNPELPLHWRGVRVQILQSADEAMADAAMLCVDCLGKPQKTRQTDLKEAFEDFVDLDWVEALQGLGLAVGADDERYRYRSPHLSVVFQPTKDIAEKLKLLADEVEKRSGDLVRDAVRPMASGSTASIDAVLSEIQLLNEAETELNRQQQIGGP